MDMNTDSISIVNTLKKRYGEQKTVTLLAYLDDFVYIIDHLLKFDVLFKFLDAHLILLVGSQLNSVGGKKLRKKVVLYPYPKKRSPQIRLRQVW